MVCKGLDETLCAFVSAAGTWLGSAADESDKARSLISPFRESRKMSRNLNPSRQLSAVSMDACTGTSDCRAAKVMGLGPDLLHIQDLLCCWLCLEKVTTLAQPSSSRFHDPFPLAALIGGPIQAASHCLMQKSVHLLRCML